MQDVRDEEKIWMWSNKEQLVYLQGVQSVTWTSTENAHWVWELMAFHLIENTRCRNQSVVKKNDSVHCSHYQALPLTGLSVHTEMCPEMNWRMSANTLHGSDSSENTVEMCFAVTAGSSSSDSSIGESFLAQCSDTATVPASTAITHTDTSGHSRYYSLTIWGTYLYNLYFFSISFNSSLENLHLESFTSGISP